MSRANMQTWKGRAAKLLLIALVVMSVNGLVSLLPADWGSRAYAAENYTIDTIVGTGTAGFSGDGGPAASARFNIVYHLAVDAAGNLYVPDQWNHVIRKVDTSGIITTVAGRPGVEANWSIPSGDGGPATSATLRYPSSVAFDSEGNMYITELGYERVRKVDTNGIISTVAGSSTGQLGYSGDGGPATSALLNRPVDVAVDSAGNLYIVEIFNHVVRKVDATTGIISTVSGTGAAGFSGDGGPATLAQLSIPYSIDFDGSGNLYIADRNNNRVRKVDTSGNISTVAGRGVAGYSGDGGPATAAGMWSPIGLTVDDDGTLYVTENGNHIVRKISPTGIITTIAGTGAFGDSGDGGPATSAQLRNPIGIDLDHNGNLYVSDNSNYKIKKLEAVTHTVTFDKNGGDTEATPSTLNVTDGETVAALPAPPTRPGYAFTGWNTLPNGGGTVFDATTVVSGNVTVYAQWSLLPSYTVTFDKNGGDTEATPSTLIVTGGETVAALPAPPTRPGYAFAGWNTLPNGGGTVFDATTVVSGNVTVYAQWSLNPPNAPANLRASPGNGQASLAWDSVTSAVYYSLYIGTASGAYDPLPLTTVTGVTYTATGLVNDTSYYFAVKAHNAAGASGFSNEASATPRAQWSTLYTVTFDKNGGDTEATPSTLIVTGGETVAALPAPPTRPGYAFAGWNTLPNGGGTVFDATTVVSGNVTVYAQWSLNPPNAPANLRASPGNGQASLAWDSVTSAVYYSLYIGTASGAYDPLPLITVTEAAYTATGLVNDTPYYFAVKAHNAAGASGFSNEASATPRTPQAPSTSDSGSETDLPTIQVVDGNSSSIVSTAYILRSPDADGRRQAEVELTRDQAARAVDRLKTLESDYAKMLITDAQERDAKLIAKFPKASADLLSESKIRMEISATRARVVIPVTTFEGVTDGLRFRIEPAWDEDLASIERLATTDPLVLEAARGGTVETVGRPMTIGSNATGDRYEAILPLTGEPLSDEQLKRVAVFALYDDGTKELARGSIVPYDGEDRLGIRFPVSAGKTGAFTAIRWMNPVHQAFLFGYADGTFAPDRNVTRAEVAAMLVRVFDRDEDAAPGEFPDVGDGHWAKEYIDRASGMSLMIGYPDGSFKPDAPITRAEMASAIAPLLPEATGASAGFTDTEGSWAQAVIEQANAAGIVYGYEDGTFRPNSTLTRAEVVTMLDRLLGRGPLIGAPQQWPDVTQAHWAYGYIQEASMDHSYEKQQDGTEKYIPEP